MKYDIFISYRRIYTYDKAEHLKDLLEPYYKKRISFDRENLRGNFNTALIGRIDKARDFLLVIDEQSLLYKEEDCTPEKVQYYRELTSLSQEDFTQRIAQLPPDAELDYVRIEIGRALRRRNINIIPIAPERSSTYSFAALNLPADIAGIKSYEAVFYSNSPDALFKDVVPRIKKHLNSHADISSWFKWICLVLAVCMCITGYFVYESYNTNGDLERQSIIEKLEGDYSSYELQIQNKEKITLMQLQALEEILGGMKEINDTLAVGTFEVTCGQYNGILDLDYDDTRTNFPITNLSPADVEHFVDELNNLISMFQGTEIDIPTATEWRLAAGDSTLIYSGSNNPNDVAWYKENSKGVIHECDGAKRDNANGLYNMSGNADEICWASEDIPALGIKNTTCVLCGGGYLSPKEHITIHSVYGVRDNAKQPEYGFRLIIRKMK